MQRLIAIVLLTFLGAVPPLLQAQTIETYTFITNRVLPDGNAAGLSDVRNVNSAIGTITSLKVRLKLTGEFNGDLYGYIRHSSGFTAFLNRPGKAAASASGYPDSGLDVTFQNAAANGEVHVYQYMTTPSAGSPLIGNWEPDGRTADPTNVTDVSVRSTSLTNFNGLNATGDWTLYLADVESGGTNMLTEWSLEIIGATSPALAWANPLDITYGTALSGIQLNAAATHNATNVPGTLTYTPPAGAVLNAGLSQTLTVTFTPTDTASFLPISTNVSINVLPAPLTITANSTNKVYGAALPSFTASYSGFVNGDTAASLDTPVILGTIATAASPAGTYTINASGAVDNNYNISYATGILTINNADTSISLTSSPNPSDPGQEIQFTATVSAANATPAGTVILSDSYTTLGTNSLSGGQTTFRISSLSVGSHIVTARYVGSNNFNGSTTTTLQTVNPSTVLEAIPDQTAYVLMSFVFTNHVINSNLLSQPLTFGLGAGAPVGVKIRTNGVLYWTPTRAQSPSTNAITVWMTDSGAVRATNTFNIIVDGYLELSLGQSVLRVGQTSSVPVTLVTTKGLTNLQALVQVPADHLVPLALIGWAPELGNATLQQQTTDIWKMDFVSAPGQELQGTQELAHLSFLAVTNRSAFVPLIVSEVITNLEADGSSIWRTLASNGRAVVIEKDSLVEALPLINGLPDLTLYGMPGVSYEILYSPVLPAAAWLPVWQGTMPTNLLMQITGLTNTESTMFFRARE